MKLNENELRILNEAFKAGDSIKVITKLIPILSKRFGKGDLLLSDMPYNYSNANGNFSGYLMFFGNEAIRINFSLGSSDKIISCDYYKSIDALFESPSTTAVFDPNEGIISIVNGIEAMVIEGVESNDEMFESKVFNIDKALKEARQNKSDGFLLRWIEDNPSVNENSITQTRLSNVFRYDFSPWLKDQGESATLATFMGAVKRYLEEHNLQNKYLYGARIKKGEKEQQVVDTTDEKTFTKQYELTVSERYTQLEAFVLLLADQTLTGLILTGKQGIGKSFTVEKALKDAGTNYGLAKGSIRSAKDLYLMLWRNSGHIPGTEQNIGKVLILDDIDGIISNKDAMNIIKGGLDTGDVRKVSFFDKQFIPWNKWIEGTDGQMERRVPSSFVFTGSIIFILNMKQSKIPAPILDRCLTLNLDLNKEEVMSKLKMSIESFPPNVDLPTKLKAFSFLLDNIESANEITYRTFYKVALLAATKSPLWEKSAFQLILAKGKD